MWVIRSVGISKIMPLVILVFAGPVIGCAFPDDRYGYALMGETGTLKTAIARLLLRVYGNGFESTSTMIKLGEGSTNTGAKLIAGMAGCMPILMDNFKPYKDWSTAELASLIHSLMEGADKARGNKEVKLRDSVVFSCLPLITGEDYPVDAATGARIMALTWTRPDMDILDQATEELRSHLPAVGRLWIEWLNSEDGHRAIEKMKAEFPRVRSEVMKEYKDIVSTNAQRLATNEALDRLGYKLMREHPVFGQYFAQFEETYNEGGKTRIRDAGAATSEASEVNVIVDMLREGIASGNLVLWPTENGNFKQVVIGWKDDKGHILIFPDVLKDYVAIHIRGGQKLSKDALARMFVNHGLIAPDKEGKSTQTKYAPMTKKAARVYVFDQDTLIDEEPRPIISEIRRESRMNLTDQYPNQTPEEAGAM
jgi:hypothetical protein